MEETDELLIPLKDLTPSESYQWDVWKDFFERFGNTEITWVNVLNIDAYAEKVGGCVKLDFGGVGQVFTLCDRCGEEMMHRVDFDVLMVCGTESALAAWQGGEPEEFGGKDYFVDGGCTRFGTSDHRERLVLPEGATEIDLSQAVYDYVCLSLPMRKVHEDGKCSPEALRRLAGMRPAEDAGNGAGNGDSPFAGLEGLFKNE